MEETILLDDGTEEELQYLYVFRYSYESWLGHAADEWQGRVKAMNTRIDGLTSQVASSQGHLADQLKSSNDAAKRQVVGEITGLKVKMTGTSQTITDLKSFVAGVKEEQTNVKSTVAAIKAKVQRLHSKLA